MSGLNSGYCLVSNVWASVFLLLTCLIALGFGAFVCFVGLILNVRWSTRTVRIWFHLAFVFCLLLVFFSLMYFTLLTEFLCFDDFFVLDCRVIYC